MSIETGNDLIIRDIRAIYDRLKGIEERFDEIDRESVSAGDFDHVSHRVDVLEDILDIMQ